ncbi:Nucleosome-remodeling factor subunit NURF301-like [Frankliniella fusca]|uniref:Nucleosome-remodeling factor subunit NURF301-like n=1 Tax=Frankliniella fusca TaxID=407009 RepID=A0AAE1H764_9NEOP|nr:Nucleosome-remodeling factor subunit NURF301-like [Frankliniella fusca]
MVDDKCPVCGRVASRSFWIECEQCLRWFHGDCVGFKSKKEADILNFWVCQMCSNRRNVGTETDFNYDPSSFVVVCVCQNSMLQSSEIRSVIICSECRKWYDKKCIRMNQNNDSITCPSCCSSVEVNLDAHKTKVVHKSSQTLIMVEKRIVDKGTNTEQQDKKMVHSSSQTVLDMEKRTVDKGTDPIIEAERKTMDNFPKREKSKVACGSRLSLSNSQKKNGIFKTSSQPAVAGKKIGDSKLFNSQSLVVMSTQATISGKNTCMGPGKHKSTAAPQSKRSSEELSDEDFLPKKKHGKL